MKRSKVKTTIRIPGPILSAIRQDSRVSQRSANDLIVSLLRERYAKKAPTLPVNQV
jgi:hypothetical protein